MLPPERSLKHMANMKALCFMVKKLCAELKFSKCRSKVRVKVTCSTFTAPSEMSCKLHTSLYDKHDDFNFHITNFPFLSSNIPFSSAYDVFTSQFIRYARACSSYDCFILMAGICKGKFEIVSKAVLVSVRGCYKTIWGPPLPNVTRYFGWWPYTMTHSID